MLANFPQGFGFDPTIMGEQAFAFEKGRSPAVNRSVGSPYPDALNRSAASITPQVVLVGDELVSCAPDADDDDVGATEIDSVAHSPLLTTALVGFVLAGASYFIGFH